MANSTNSGRGQRQRRAQAYGMGAPFTFGPGRDAVLDDLYKLHDVVGDPAEKEAWKNTDNFLYDVSGRLTDKSAAVLQIISVIAAIELLLLPPADLPRLSSWLSIGSALLFSFSALLLWMNLFQRWPNAGFRNEGDRTRLGGRRRAWRIGILHIIQWRTLRHTVALAFIGVSGLMFFGGLVAKYGPIVHAALPSAWVVPWMSDAPSAPSEDVSATRGSAPASQPEQVQPPAQ